MTFLNGRVRRMFVIQNQTRPGEIQNALRDLMRDGVESVRVCSAYVTRKGSELLYDEIRRSSRNGDQDAVSKTIVASLDFGTTEPQALEYWMEIPGSRVLVAGADLLERRTLNPKVAFHPKVYAFGRPNGTVGSLTGSANLTSRGLTINSEAAWCVPKHASHEEVDVAWQSITQGTTPLTQELLDQYRLLREQTIGERQTRETQPVPEPEVGQLGDYQPFAVAVADPDRHARMWIQARQLQGGSHTQLELPRGSHRFFGAVQIPAGADQVVRLAELVLTSGQSSWPECPLTWHPNNQMERINLPSIAKGGYDYNNTLILFRRLGEGRFELQAHPWDSDSCRAFVEASRTTNLLFRVGRNSNRLYGLLP
ncbi:MAG: phospholipase D family protein [Gammaproteobacteria bacterium]|nr:phospholipase D family protein [Gammaproteobacteria bacterium]